jgi:GNAT superfamily N-acetyltransferase
MPQVGDLIYRPARAKDLPAIVAMYADDPFSNEREDAGDPLPSAYLRAFEEVNDDPRHQLIVVEEAGEVVGTLQLSFLPHLVMMGGTRAQIEAVRVRDDRRGCGIGQQMIEWAVDQARAKGCRLVQLTTDARREDARRFYERIGFRPTHVGMKLTL